MTEDIALDFYCGLGGWAEGLLSEGFTCIGFDVERHDYGTGGYPGQLILQDVLTICGAQFRSIVDRIRVLVASPPCTEYSYMAMPWKRARQIARALRDEDKFPADYKGSRTIDQLNALFFACFRIQRELSAVAGRHIPLIVENVKGAQPWVGMAKANFGSYYLWGDVGRIGNRVVPLNGKLGQDVGVRPRSLRQKVNPDGTGHGLGSWFAVADSKTRGASAQKNPEFRFDGSGKSFQSESVKTHGQNWSRHAKTGEVSPHWRMEALKNEGHLNIRDGHSHTRHLMNPAEHVKGFNGSASGRGNLGKNELGRMAWSNSEKRKQASAMIAKIPFPLASHIARCFSTAARATS